MLCRDCIHLVPSFLQNLRGSGWQARLQTLRPVCCPRNPSVSSPSVPRLQQPSPGQTSSAVRCWAFRAAGPMACCSRSPGLPSTPLPRPAQLTLLPTRVASLESSHGRVPSVPSPWSGQRPLASRGSLLLPRALCNPGPRLRSQLPASLEPWAHLSVVPIGVAGSSCTHGAGHREHLGRCAGRARSLGSPGWLQGGTGQQFLGASPSGQWLPQPLVGTGSLKPELDFQTVKSKMLFPSKV